MGGVKGINRLDTCHRGELGGVLTIETLNVEGAPEIQLGICDTAPA
jgi:hypothetical protein